MFHLSKLIKADTQRRKRGIQINRCPINVFLLCLQGKQEVGDLGVPNREGGERRAETFFFRNLPKAIENASTLTCNRMFVEKKRKNVVFSWKLYDLSDFLSAAKTTQESECLNELFKTCKTLPKFTVYIVCVAFLFSFFFASLCSSLPSYSHILNHHPARFADSIHSRDSSATILRLCWMRF